MRLLEIAVRGITCFRDEYRIDFSRLGRLVALVGRNGAGKTTLLEAAPAALYRAFPTREGNLAAYATARDSMLFARIALEDGAELLSTVRVDVDSRKVEHHLMLQNGHSQTPLTEGRIAEADAWIGSHLGSWESLLAGAFCAQDRQGSLLGMVRGARRELFAELLAIDSMQLMADAARARRTTVELELAAAQGILDRAPSAEDAERAAIAVELAGNVERSARIALAAHEAMDARATEMQTRREALERLRLDLGIAVEDGKRRDSEWATLTPPLEPPPLEPQLQMLDQRRVAEAAAFDDRHKRAWLRLSALPDQQVLRDELAEAERVREQASAAASSLQARLGDLQQRGLKLASTQGVLRARLVHAEKELARASDSPSAASAPCLDQPTLVESCPLLRKARGIDEWIAASQAERTVVMTEFTQVAADQTELESELQKLPTTERDDATKAAIEIGRLRNSIATTTATRLELEREIDWVARQRGEADGRILRDQQLVRESHAKAVRHFEAELGRNQTRRSQLEESAERARELTFRLNQQIEVLESEIDSSIPDPQITRREIQARRAELEYAIAQLAQAGAKEEQLRGQLAEAEMTRGTVQQLTRNAHDWSILERAFGRDGLQALEVEAAAPGVARLATELLEACYGPRFAVEIRTQRERLAAKGQREVLDLIVLDGAHERPAEALSGGERAILSEALGLALVAFTSRRTGRGWKTLWRDETAGALDARNALRYVAMLRRACDLGGFEQCIFVSHQPEVCQLADDVIEIGADP